ncbi:MAG: hypothetical protein CSA95_08945 [Bacteroidetes bacterium]|nr:MAG: hypothetical protein CSA95_08945 [Bacteroidota bacterium]PIE88128.1 MAG: hypothetical protein CSA04_03460 [Bacteroidota bacterium]
MSPFCPFCAPSIEDAVFGETAHFRAICNIAPILPGHVMIIPKRHYQSLFEVPQPHLYEMILFASRVTAFLKVQYCASGFDWSLQEGVDAGQSVMHLHWHIIPRKKNDLPSSGAWYQKLKEQQMEEIDSQKRPRITPEELKQQSTLLKTAFQQFSQKSDLTPSSID